MRDTPSPSWRAIEKPPARFCDGAPVAAAVGVPAWSAVTGEAGSRAGVDVDVNAAAVPREPQPASRVAEERDAPAVRRSRSSVT